MIGLCLKTFENDLQTTQFWRTAYSKTTTAETIANLSGLSNIYTIQTNWKIPSSSLLKTPRTNVAKYSPKIQTLFSPNSSPSTLLVFCSQAPTKQESRFLNHCHFTYSFKSLPMGPTNKIIKAKVVYQIRSYITLSKNLFTSKVMVTRYWGDWLICLITIIFQINLTIWNTSIYKKINL